MKPLPLIALLLLSAPAAADVYFIQAGPAIKIGVSSDPARRLRTFQTANPVKLELLGTTEGGRDLEQRFHDCLMIDETKGMNMKKYLAILVFAPFLAACPDDAQVANENMRKAADNFEIMRRVVFYNSITDKVIMVSEGRCSVSPGEFRTSVICKIGDGRYIRNFYGRSDNTAYFVEQMDPIPVNVYHYRRTFKPQTLMPDIDFRGSAGEAVKALTPDKTD